jgi:hypothetical protein
MFQSMDGPDGSDCVVAASGAGKLPMEKALDHPYLRSFPAASS